ncbi:MAG TPA: hypothetical protein VKT77_18715 [Chthonomonadaceae bacterium]|nr:hypothetical protein [Chthonomonadaceae bacterium]
MVTAQRQLAMPHPGSLAPALKRPMPAPPPRVGVVPKSRRRLHQAWMTMLVIASGLVLSLGILSLYGRICQTQEINRRSALYTQLNVAKQRGGELTLQRAKAESDANIAVDAARLGMIRKTDSDAVTIP